MFLYKRKNLTLILTGLMVNICILGFSRVVSCQEVGGKTGTGLWKAIAPESQIPLEDWIEIGVDWLAINLASFFDGVAFIIRTINNAIYTGLSFVPIFAFSPFDVPIFFPLLTLALALLVWWLSSWTAGLFTLGSLWLLYYLGLWVQTVNTLSLTLTSAFVSLIIGIPLGIAAAKSDDINAVITPILDFMQTMPVFVYLIPAVVFFGLGSPAGVFATVIFALPPAVRLTDLGIREIPKEIVEAGRSFGCNSFQLLFKVEIPMARPAIVTGVNQTIMMALSMVVIAAMIGAGGLGGEVVAGIQRMLVGKGVVAGLGVVIIAIMLDRATKHLGEVKKRT